MTPHRYLERVESAALVAEIGWVRKVLPSFLEADGPWAPLRTICQVETHEQGPNGVSTCLAEVVSVEGGAVVLAPLEVTVSSFVGARIDVRPTEGRAPVGDALLGRAVDGLGRPIDGQGAIAGGALAAANPQANDPLQKASPEELIATGLRVIDGLLPLGQGQRIGLFAASGVGKTTLMSQLARQIEAERCVICLIGERGHEVGALWRRGLKDGGRERSVLVTASADQPAAMRVRAADYAIALAQQWRAEGHRVLLLLDSVTRLAMALREIGLAAGEPPTVRGYTPSVFTALARLVEHCGALEDGGSITAVMTVLAETDDVEDPLAEAMKSFLDGHIVLSRSLAERGHFPAVDVPRSVSRWADKVVDQDHRDLIRQAIAALSTYEEARTLIESGVYSAGSDPDIDRAIVLRAGLLEFLQQSEQEAVPYEDTVAALASAVERGAQNA